MSSGIANGRRIRIPNEEITWAGECPWTKSYCLGTESGRLFFYKNAGNGVASDFPEVRAEEAINGVAFHDEFLGITTRSEISFFRRNSKGGLDEVHAEPGGAHEILATRKGKFFAPMGPEGLFCFDVSVAAEPQAWTDRAHGVSLNFYSLTLLGDDAGKEILACAGRTDGIIRLQYGADNRESTITTLAGPKTDFVDVCSFGSTRWPFAVAAIRLDRSVVLVRDLRGRRATPNARFR